MTQQNAACSVNYYCKKFPFYLCCYYVKTSKYHQYPYKSFEQYFLQMVIWSSQYTIHPFDLIKVRLRNWSSIKINKGCQGLMIFDLSMYKMSHPQQQMGTLGTLATHCMALGCLTMASEGGRDKSKIRFICCPPHTWTLDSTLSNLTTSACVVLVARALISTFMKGPVRLPSQSCK